MAMFIKAKIGEHPLHPMLVAFPITFYFTTVIAFGVYQWVNPDIFWYKLAYFCNMAGVGTAVLAAIPGFIDWAFGIPRSSAASARGLTHMLLNIIALLLFTISAVLIRNFWETAPSLLGINFFLTLVGVLATGVAGYHGWNLIAVHKVGVRLTPEQAALEPLDETDPMRHDQPLRPRTI